MALSQKGWRERERGKEARGQKKLPRSLLAVLGLVITQGTGTRSQVNVCINKNLPGVYLHKQRRAGGTAGSEQHPWNGRIPPSFPVPGL